MVPITRLLPVIICSCILFLTPPMTTFSFADSLHFQSDTILRYFERDTTKGTDQQVFPAYQYFSLDTGKGESGGLSFHGRAWGRADFSDSAYYSDQNDGELDYAYLEYTASSTVFKARLGRQPVFDGGANESIDGLSVSTAFGQYVSLSGYGGLPVALSSAAGSGGDSIFGGRVAFHKGSDVELGVFYKNLANDGSTQEESLGFDLFANLPMNSRFYGSSTWNMETEGWAEHIYELRIPVDDFTFRPYYQTFNYEDFFASGTETPNPFRLLSSSGESLTTVGLDVTWKASPAWSFGGKVKQHSYDNNDASQYVALLTTWSNEDNGLAQVGTEISYLKGDAANNDYVLLRLYGYKEQLGQALWIDILSADLVYASYNRDILGESASLFGSLSLGKNFFDDSLKLTFSGDYSQTPYFDEDLRALFKMTYVFDFSM